MRKIMDTSGEMDAEMGWKRSERIICTEGLHGVAGEGFNGGDCDEESDWSRWLYT